MSIEDMDYIIIKVAPLAGAWIEIVKQALDKAYGEVAPLAGAWIEIIKMTTSVQKFFVVPFMGL